MCTMRAAVLGGHPQGTWSWQTWGRLQLQNCTRPAPLSVETEQGARALRTRTSQPRQTETQSETWQEWGGVWMRRKHQGGWPCTVRCASPRERGRGQGRATYRVSGQ